MLAQAQYVVSTVCFIGMLQNGYSKKSMRIIGGSDVDPTKYAYVVRLESHISLSPSKTRVKQKIRMRHTCTCAALTSTWILIAAHCNKDLKIPPLQLPNGVQIKAIIRYGSVSSKPPQKNAFSDVILAISHPNFKIKVFEVFGVAVCNDIGLLKTDPIKLNEYGKISAVDYSALVGQRIVMVGYGLMNVSGKFKTTLAAHKPLQVTNVVVKKCEDYESGVVNPSLCVAQRCGRNTGGACPGDSGGPLFHPSGIIGVISGGDSFKCNKDARLLSDHFISDYMTPVSPYVDWIMSVIGKDAPKIS